MVILEIRPMVGLCRDSSNRLLPVFSNKILYIPLNLCSLVSRDEYEAISVEKTRFNYPINVDVIVVDQKDQKDGKDQKDQKGQGADSSMNNDSNVQGDNISNISNSNNKKALNVCNNKDKVGIKLLNAKLIDNNKNHYKVVGRYADLGV